MTATPVNLTSVGLRKGDKIDKYEVIEQIGAGGFSVVFKAYDRLLDQAVAVKQLVVDASVDEDAFRERFRREAAIQKRVSQSHKSLVRVIDFIEEPRGLFIIMEFVDGPSLEQVLAQNLSPIDVKTALGIAGATAVALGAIHDQGIIHRDLKPANVLLPKSGGLKLCDFGLATLMAGQEQPAVGTVRYMAPEILAAQQADGRSDIYSLGFMLYEMLLGRQNFDDAFKVVLRDPRNQALRWMKWHTNLKVKVPPLKQYVPNLPQPIAELVERMIEKDPGQRIASAGQLIDAMKRQLMSPAQAALAGAGTNLPAVPGVGPLGDKTARLPKKNKLVYIIAATVMAWSVIGIGWMMYDQGQKNKVRQLAEGVVHADYKAALGLFKAEKYQEAGDAFRAILDTHANHAKMPVPVAGNKRSALQDAAEGHIFFCRAMQHLSAGRFTEAIADFDAADELTVLDRTRISQKRDEAVNARSHAAMEDKIKKYLADDPPKFNLAQMEYAKFMKGASKSLTQSQKDNWDNLGQQIQAQKDAREAEEVLARAKDMELNDRVGAIAYVEDWLLKHADNPNRTVAAYLGNLQAASNFDLLVIRGRSAAQRGEIPLAIKSFEDALAANPTKGEQMKLPTEIRLLKANAAYAAAKTAFDGGNAELAIQEATRALSENPDHAEAKAMLKQIDSAAQVAALERQAVAAFDAREYDKAINLWKRLRDEFGADSTKVAAEIAKSEFQVAVAAMEKAWAGTDDNATLAAIEAVLVIDANQQRAAVLKALIQTRKRFLTLLASGEAAEKRGEYGESKRELRKAREIAVTISDALVRDELVAKANQRLDEVEYIDNFSKAKRDFQLDKLNEARAWAMLAVKGKNSPEARTLLAKIEQALAKKPPE